MRLTHAQRDRLFGPPCSEERLVVVELFGCHVRVHQLLRERLVLTMQAADRALLGAGVHETRPQRVDGYNCRDIRRLDNPSLHAYGLAWDIFRTPPGLPPPGGVLTPSARLHPIFVAVMERAGFTWGGRFRRPDQPHFEWAAAPP